MALDSGLLATAEEVIARRYTWAPPALSLGRFQRFEPLPPTAPPLPFDVVRRPTGGRAVLHGEAFEWSFAVAFPSGLFAGPRATVDVKTPYALVAVAFAAALQELGVTLDATRETPYRRSALCFASTLRYDLCSRGQKLVAMAQARSGGRALVHGSVLLAAPPAEMARAAEALLGEPWEGEGMAGAGIVLAPEMLWAAVLRHLERALRRLTRR
jgi:lipoate-protein ligase A